MAKPVGNSGVKITVRIGKKSKTFPSIQAAGKAFGIPYNTLYQRLFIVGWSAKDALTTPVRKRKKAKNKKRKNK